MMDLRRFGRRLPLPSTAQIIHELRMVMLEDRIKELQKEIASNGTPGPAPERDGGGGPCSTKSQ